MTNSLCTGKMLFSDDVGLFGGESGTFVDLSYVCNFFSCAIIILWKDKLEIRKYPSGRQIGPCLSFSPGQGEGNTSDLTIPLPAPENSISPCQRTRLYTSLTPTLTWRSCCIFISVVSTEYIHPERNGNSFKRQFPRNIGYKDKLGLPLFWWTTRSRNLSTWGFVGHGWFCSPWRTQEE